MKLPGFFVGVTVRLCAVLLWTTTHYAKGNFVLTVNFINYTNPTGLCAECRTGLEAVTNASQLTPVCCDESPFRSDSCDNTGEARCDTRFRWTIRPFGASLETRPSSNYYFTDCDLSSTTCPFSEMSTTFSQGPTGFLGVAENPLPIITTAPWTGSVQFFIEAVDSGLPSIVDSLLVDLDNLQLGSDFTEEMTFTGSHNISHMTMSFKVACQTGFCGRDCMARRLANPRIQSCHPNGDVVCNGRYDPSTICQSCLHNLDVSTDCSTCLESNFDPKSNCTACLPNFDPDNSCSTCLPNFDLDNSCSTCLKINYDPHTNCTQCLPNRELSTNCTQCSHGWDISSDCMSCLPGRDLTTDCTQCLPNHDLSTDCSTCLFGFDINSDCLVCLPGGNISTDCTTCESGYTGESCVLCTVTSTSPTLSVTLVGGIAGGVIAVLVIVILVMAVIIALLSYCVIKSKRSGENTTTAYKESEAEMTMKENPVYDVTTGGPPQPSSTDTDGILLQPNVLYGVSTGPDRGDQTTHCQPQTNQLDKEYDYVQP